MNKRTNQQESYAWHFRFFLGAAFGFYFFLSSNSALAKHVALLIIATFSLSAFLYLVLRKRYTKSLRLIISFFLLICIFPLTYYTVYLRNKNSFSYEESILNLNKVYNKEALAHFSDSNEIRACLKLSDSVLNRRPSRKILYNGFYFKVKPAGLFTSQWECNILNRNKKFILNIEFTQPGYPLRYYINEYLRIMEIVKSDFHNPKFIFLRDFWFESLSGFSFGDIKAVSPFARFLRVLQLIATFIFAGFLLSLSDTSKYFQITKAKKSKSNS